MEKTIDEYLVEIKKKEKEIEDINFKLQNYITVDLNKENEKIKTLKQEILDLQKIKFVVNLGELIEEISSLTGVERKDLNLKVKTNINKATNKRINLNDFFCKYGLYNQSYLVNITFGNILNCFYNFSTILKEDDKFNNNTTFFENLRLTTSLKNGIYNNVLFIKNVNGLNFPLELRQITKKEMTTWYPAEIIKKAVENCIEKNKTRKKQTEESFKKD